MNRIRNSWVDVPKALKVTHKNVRGRESLGHGWKGRVCSPSMCETPRHCVSHVYMPVILALRRLRPENEKIKVILDYTVIDEVA